MVSRITHPFDALLEMQRAMERAFNSNWLGHATTSRGAFPPVNVFQQNDDLVVIAEMPGVKKENLEITIQRDQLRIAGERDIDYGDKISVHRQERLAGKFDRTFTLPLEIDADGVRAEYNDGLLALHLPRAEKDRPKQIAVG